MPQIKAVLFDLDGTLLDTAPDFADVVNRLLAEESRPAMEFQQVRESVTRGSRSLIENAFQMDPSDSKFEPLRQRLLDYYLESLTNKTRPFQGVGELLNELEARTIPWGIVTNKPVLYTTPIVKGLALSPSAIICPDHVTHTKPHPESVELACQQIGCHPSESIMIGDHERDIEAGKNAGALTIAAAYGYLSHGEDANNWQADYLAHQSTDLQSILEPLL